MTIKGPGGWSMLLSIVVVNWNTRDLLIKFLISINEELKGSAFEWEIIVVDNASTDGSPDVVSKISPEVKVIVNHSNFGYAKALNIGVRETSGEFLCIANSDTEVLDNSIQKLLSYILRNQEVGLVAPMLISPNGSIESNCKSFPNLFYTFSQALFLHQIFPHLKSFHREITKFLPKSTPSFVDEVAGTFFILRRKAFEDCDGFDEDFYFYGEDSDFSFRLCQKGWKIVYYPGAKVIHIGGASAAQAWERSYMEAEKAKLLFWIKHKRRVEVILFIFVRILSHLLRFLFKAFRYISVRDRRSPLHGKIILNLKALRFYLYSLLTAPFGNMKTIIKGEKI